MSKIEIGMQMLHLPLKLPHSALGENGMDYGSPTDLPGLGGHGPLF